MNKQALSAPSKIYNENDRRYSEGGNKPRNVLDLKQQITGLLEEYIHLMIGTTKDADKKFPPIQDLKWAINNVFTILDSVIKKTKTLFEENKEENISSSDVTVQPVSMTSKGNVIMEPSLQIMVETQEQLADQRSCELSTSSERENLLSSSHLSAAGKLPENVSLEIEHSLQQLGQKSTNGPSENAPSKYKEENMSYEIMRKLEYINATLQNIQAILLRNNK